MIWYAAYGSNLSYERFMCYIEGRCPAGSTKPAVACADTTPPREVRPYQLDGTVYFARESTSWSNGGVAFLDIGDGSAYSRLYLLTDEQFEHVALCEGPQWYDMRHEAGALDSHPIVTLTSSVRHEPNRPSEAYLAHVRRGLHETHGLSDDEINAYLESVTVRSS